MDDTAVLAKALTGADILFWCVPQSNEQTDVLEYYLAFTRPLAKTLEDQGGGRVVAVSSGGRGRARNAGPISALHAMEEMIESTGVEFRALRNGNFMENLLWQVEPIKHQGMFFHPLGGNVAMPTCAARDISASAVKLLRDRTWTGQGGLAVHGPVDLSCNEMARTMTTVLGKPVRFQEVPPPGYVLTHAARCERGLRAEPRRYVRASRPRHLRRRAAHARNDNADHLRAMVQPGLEAGGRTVTVNIEAEG
jgi:uncharacterized protein YbjT (DUF2867 family)